LLGLLAIVLVVALPAAVAAAVAVALIVLMVGTIGFRRYRLVNSQDDFERPGNEELLRSVDALLRRRNYRDLDEDRSSDSRQR
jgi:hypothetical protein